MAGLSVGPFATEKRSHVHLQVPTTKVVCNPMTIVKWRHTMRIHEIPTCAPLQTEFYSMVYSYMPHTCHNRPLFYHVFPRNTRKPKHLHQKWAPPFFVIKQCIRCLYFPVISASKKYLHRQHQALLLNDSMPSCVQATSCPQHSQLFHLMIALPSNLGPLKKKSQDPWLGIPGSPG